MKMQIRRFQVRSGSAEALCKQAALGVPPIVRQIPGFLDYYVVNGGDGTVFSVTVFEDQEGLDEAHRKVMEWTRENAAAQLPKAPEIMQGEVVYAASLGALGMGQRAA